MNVAEALADELPAAPARLLLVARDPLPIVDGLRPGHAIEWLRADGEFDGALLPSARYDAVVLCDVPAAWRAAPALAALRERLDDGGRLIALAGAGPGAPGGTLVPWPELVVGLSEAGFRVERHEHLGSLPRAGCRLRARKDPVVVRGYRDGDEGAIRALFVRSFGHDPGSAHWAWKYRANPLGGLRSSVAVTSDETLAGREAPVVRTGGRLVGHYGGYPVAFVDARSASARTWLAHQVGDTTTVPAVRRLGRGPTAVLGRLARHFWAAYGEGRVAFHYGINTATAREYSLRFVPGVRRQEDVAVWACDRTSLAAGPLRSMRLRLEGWRVEPLARFDSDADALFERVARAYDVLVRRDSAYLNWRYVERPDVAYTRLAVRRLGKLAGWAVFRATDDALRCGDALFEPGAPDAVAALLDAASHLPDAPARVEGWFPERPAWWAAALARHGFQRERQKDDLSLVYAAFDDCVHDALGSLYFTAGDSDLF